MKTLTVGERDPVGTKKDLRGFAVRFYTEAGNWENICTVAMLCY